MPKDRTRGKAGHSAGTKRDKAIRAARAEVEKRQRQLAGAMADLAALEARHAGHETGAEPVVPSDEPGTAATDDPPAEIEPAGSGQWIGELEPDPAEAPDSTEAHEAAGAADGAETAEASDSAESPDSALIG
jgi:hypothetical protein